MSQEREFLTKGSVFFDLRLTGEYPLLAIRDSLAGKELGRLFSRADVENLATLDDYER